MAIEVTRTQEDDNSFIFDVTVDGSDFSVEVEEMYYNQLTKGEVNPEEFVEESFKFLLDREPKESILKQFNIRAINNYFPDYEEEIKALLSK